PSTRTDSASALGAQTRNRVAPASGTAPNQDFQVMPATLGRARRPRQLLGRARLELERIGDAQLAARDGLLELELPHRVQDAEDQLPVADPVSAGADHPATRTDVEPGDQLPLQGRPLRQPLLVALADGAAVLHDVLAD